VFTLNEKHAFSGTVIGVEQRGPARNAYRYIGSLLGVALMALGLTVVEMVINAKPAFALCAASKLQGNWHNIDANTKSMSRLEVSFTCNDQRVCDEHGNCTGPDIYHSMRPWGKCETADCDWGVRRAANTGDGWIVATYDFGFKTSYVSLKTYEADGVTRLRVKVVNDFTPADGRPDYTSEEWMIR
jgi:hypothetical protein